MASAQGSGESFGEALRATIREASEPPRTSYTARSAAAQYKHLMRTQSGRDALAEAGLTAAPQTRRRWVAHRQNPGRANAAKIHEAYDTMTRGRIPRAVKEGKMRITGRVGTGPDVRDRGTRGSAPLEIDLSRGNWTRIEQGWADEGTLSNRRLEEVASEDLIEPDIGGSDWWYFPGGSYIIEISY
jgi:hypothetical protein